jgi:hypothetical protein
MDPPAPEIFGLRAFSKAAISGRWTKIRSGERLVFFEVAPEPAIL